MNYRRLYEYLVKSRQEINRVKVTGDGMETHHILPRCLGGGNDKDNLVIFTPKEHYVAHHLLVKMYTGPEKAKLSYAFLKMCQNNPKQGRSTTSRQFEAAKLAVSLYCQGEFSSSYGRRHSAHTRLTMSTQRTGSRNPAYGKSPWNKGLSIATSAVIEQVSKKAKQRIKEQGHNLLGRRLTQEQKDHIGSVHRGIPKSTQHKQKLSTINTGKVLSIETKQKMSSSRKGKCKPIHTCPHCGKQGAGSAMKRWHFDKCAALPI